MFRKADFFCVTTALILVCVALSACSKTEAQRYELQGKVVHVDKKGRTVSIAHKAIPGYMEEMTMPFRFSEKDQWAFEALETGSSIHATLVVAGERSWLENPVISQERKDESGRTGKVTEPLPGDEIADYTLVNQDGKKISIHQYKGKALLLTFIYTRCPLPDYCPLMTGNFAQINQALKQDSELYQKTRLLSITVDPEYDTPAVLREYGINHNGGDGFGQWEFATGTPAEIKTIATNFGLAYSTENEQIVHNLQTALIAPDGKLVKIYRSNDWKPSEVVSDLQNLYQK